MALISCPECGKQISSRALSCPNCGCPIVEVELPTTTYKAKVLRKSFRSKFNRWLLDVSTQELRSTGANFQQGDTVSLQDSHDQQIAEVTLSTYTQISNLPTTTFGFDGLPNEIAEQVSYIVKTVNTPSKVETNNQVRCPKCGSTQIQIVPRKYTIWAGFATNKVDRVCLNCKHKF